MLYPSKLSKTLGHQYNLKELEDNGEQYCKETNQDYRIYSLGILFAKNIEDTQDYLERFFKCFIDLEDYTNIWSEYTIFQLKDQLQYCKDDSEVTKTVNNVISLLEQYGDNIPKDKARSAESAARSAAWSAACSAELAAKSAAWSAAKSAAWSAAESAAWSAAESAAWSAAESAAWSAAESAARSAELAAWSAKFEKLANKFIEIMEKKCHLNTK